MLNSAPIIRENEDFSEIPILLTFLKLVDSSRSELVNPKLQGISLWEFPIPSSYTTVYKTAAEGKYPFGTHIQVSLIPVVVENVWHKIKQVKKVVFCHFENVNHVIKGHVQHDKDQFFYNRTEYNRKILLKFLVRQIHLLFHLLRSPTMVPSWYYHDETITKKGGRFSFRLWMSKIGQLVFSIIIAEILQQNERSS